MSEEITTNNLNENRHLRDKKNINYFEDSNNNDEDDNSDYNEEEIEKEKEKEKEKLLGSKRKRKQKEGNNKDNNNNNNNENNENSSKKNKFNTSSKKNTNISSSNTSNKKKKDEINLENIINLKELSNKTEPLLNSEMILTILEICLNSSKYGLENKDNSSRSFWDKISDINEINFLVKNFKPETLRKYWRKLRSAKKYQNIVNAVNKYADKINDKEIKLLSSINIISDFTLMPSKGFDYYLNKFFTKENNKKNKDTKEEHIEKIVKDLSKIYTDITKEEIYEIINSVKGKVEDADEILKNRTKEIEEMEKKNIKNEEDEKIENNNDDNNENLNDNKDKEKEEDEKNNKNNVKININISSDINNNNNKEDEK